MHEKFINPLLMSQEAFGPCDYLMRFKNMMVPANPAGQDQSQASVKVLGLDQNKARAALKNLNRVEENKQFGVRDMRQYEERKGHVSAFGSYRFAAARQEEPVQT